MNGENVLKFLHAKIRTCRKLFILYREFLTDKQVESVRVAITDILKMIEEPGAERIIVRKKPADN